MVQVREKEKEQARRRCRRWRRKAARWEEFGDHPWIVVLSSVLAIAFVAGCWYVGATLSSGNLDGLRWHPPTESLFHADNG